MKNTLLYKIAHKAVIASTFLLSLLMCIGYRVIDAARKPAAPMVK